MDKPIRCDYCSRMAIVIRERSALITKQGHAHVRRWKIGACCEHMNCIAWTGLMELLDKRAAEGLRV